MRASECSPGCAYFGYTDYGFTYHARASALQAVAPHVHGDAPAPQHLFVSASGGGPRLGLRLALLQPQLAAQRRVEPRELRLDIQPQQVARVERAR